MIGNRQLGSREDDLCPETREDQPSSSVLSRGTVGDQATGERVAHSGRQEWLAPPPPKGLSRCWERSPVWAGSPRKPAAGTGCGAELVTRCMV